MADRIHINPGRAEDNAGKIESAASYLAVVVLTPQDTGTTLPANAKSKEAYEKSQARIADLGRMLDQEVRNIRGLKVSFCEFDEMMGRLTQRGSRYPVIRGGA